MIEIIAGWVELIVKSLVVKHGNNLPETPQNFFKRIGWLPREFQDELKKVLTTALTKVSDEYPILMELNLSDTVVVPLLTPIVEYALYEVQLPDLDTLKSEFDNVKEYEWELIALENSRDINIESFLVSFNNHLYEAITATMDMSDRAIVLYMRDEIAKLKEFTISLIQVRNEKAELARVSDVLLGHLHEDIIQPHQIASGKIFVSYSRKNRNFAKALYAKLARMGFKLWRDVHDIEAGADDWWQSIQEAIGECETVILCMSMSALKSSVVGDEWFYARTLGKRIIPVVVDEIWEDKEVKSKTFTIPNWMTRKNWMDFRKNTPEADSAWANFIRTLNESYEPKRFIDMVGELPPRFVRRPEELDNAVRSLVDDNNDAVAMTTALKGAGGYGKTTLAKAVARDIRIQGAFDDGILWVTLGEELLQRKGDELKNALIGRVLDLIYALTGERVALESLEMARTKLAEAIGDLYILLVIDDVWDEAHLKPFLVKTKHSACLITTRNTDSIRDDSIAKQPIDKMKRIEATELLSAGIKDRSAVQSQDDKLRHLARELREYPLVLALANTHIVNYMTDMRLSLADAIQLANEILSEQGVLGFDDTNAEERTRAVSSTLDVSIRQLQPEERQRMYKELAIFPEDVVIPLTTLEKYWGLSKVATLQFCQLLYHKTALLHSFESMAIRIHDVFRDYLISQWTSDELLALHQRLVTNYGDLYNLPDNYAWRNIGYHLIGANQPKQLRELLLTYGWLDKKINATDANPLLQDCGLLLREGKDEPIRLIQSALQMSIHVLDKDKNALAHQLAGRLMHHYHNDEIHIFWDSINPPKNSLHPIMSGYDSLNPAGGMMLRTMKHDSTINGVIRLHDGRILSWSQDKTLRIWNNNGTLIMTLTGHTMSVNRAMELSDGRILSWGSSYEDVQELYLWNSRGNFVKELNGHTREINGVLELGDGRILSWGDDATLCLWNQDGSLQTVLDEHTRAVTGALLTSEGNILSWGDDATLRLWDMNGNLLYTLKGQLKEISGALALRNGNILSWADSFYLWNSHGERVKILTDEFNTNSAIETSDGRIVILYRDGLHIFDLHGNLYDKTDNKDIFPIRFHRGQVRELTNGYFVSWGGFGMALWNSNGELLQEISNDSTSIGQTIELPNNLLLSWDDKILRIWDFKGKLLKQLQGHETNIRGAIALSDYRILSWGDESLHIWEVETEPIETRRLPDINIEGILVFGHDKFVSWDSNRRRHRRIRREENDNKPLFRIWNIMGQIIGLPNTVGHSSDIEKILLLSNNNLLSWSGDYNICFWDSSGILIYKYSLHTKDIIGVLELTQGSILSWGKDKKLVLWQLETVKHKLLEGHEDVLQEVKYIPNKYILAYQVEDNRIFRWDLDGKLLNIQEHHQNPINGIFVLNDNRILSWDEENIFIWNIEESKVERLNGDYQVVTNVYQLSSGWIITEHKTLWYIWNETLSYVGTRGELPLKEDSTTISTINQNKRIRAYSSVKRYKRMRISNIRSHFSTSDILSWSQELTHEELKETISVNAWLPNNFLVDIDKKQLIVWDAKHDKQISAFYGEAKFQCIAIKDNVIVAGDEAGRVIFLRWVGE